MKKAKSSSHSTEQSGKDKEFDNFARLAKALVSVPKKEVERQRAKEEKSKAAKIPR